MYKLKPTIANITPYAPSVGEYKIRLDANESFLTLRSETVARAIKDVCLNRYPDANATLLISAFADFYGVSADYVTAGNGSDELLYLIISAFLPTVGNLIRLEYDFSMYSFYAELAEKNVHILRKDGDLRIVADDVIAAVNALGGAATDNILVFSNPCNPTSLGLDKADVIRIIENANALVILDEAYMDFWHDDQSESNQSSDNQSLIRTAHKYDNLILLRTASKAVAAAGLRIGFAVAGERLTRAIRAAKSPYNVNSLSQAVGRAIYCDKAGAAAAVSAVKAETRFLYGEVVKLSCFTKVYETAANFVFIKTDRAGEIYEYLKQRGILIRNIDGHLRITAGSRAENLALLEALRGFK